MASKLEKKYDSLRSRLRHIGEKARDKKSLGEAAIVGVMAGRATGHWLGKRTAEGKSTSVPYLNVSAPKALGVGLIGAGIAGAGNESTNLKLVVAGACMLAVDQGFVGYQAELTKAAAAAGVDTGSASA